MCSNNIKHSYNENTEKGRVIAQNSTCFIGGLARNIGSHLEHTMFSLLQQLSNQFSSSITYIYENDSTDNTKNVLCEWSNGSTQIAQCNTLNHPRMSDFSARRIQLMCYYRNNILEKLYDVINEFDYFIMLDLDLYWFDINGIMNTIGQSNWDGVASNGRKYKSFSRKNNIYYDIFGHRELDEPLSINPMQGGRIPKLQDKYAGLNPGDDMVEVASAFNGLAIYRTESIRQCTYVQYDGYAEHVGFHHMIRQKGGRIFINPSQLTFYDRPTKEYYDQYISNNLSI